MDIINPLISVIVLLNSIFVCHCDYFSSSADIEHLLKVEQNLIRSINDYVDTERERLERVKVIAAEEASKELNVDLNNPVNVFLTIKRIIQSDVLRVVRENTANDYLEDLYKELPEEKDLNGAVVALLRLQDMYSLDVNDIARGIIPGITEENRKPLNSGDCYHIARVAYEAGDYHHAILWFYQVWDRISELNATTQYDKSTVLDYLSFALYSQGNLQRAWWLTKILVALDPENDRAVNNIDRYAEEIIEKGMKIPKSEKDLPGIQNSKNYPEGYITQMDYPLYQPLCTGQRLTNRTSESILLCTLKSDTPLSVLRPYKVEQILSDPDIWIMHDMVRQEEVDQIINISKPLLARALVKDRTAPSAKDVPASYRIAKSAWVAETSNSMVRQLNTRLADASGLSMETSELLQIANYGIGGQYEPHFDMATKNLDQPYRENNGNRIATALVYLSTPLAGGATIFESLQVRVPAIQGDVLFWYNLKRSGDPDLRMKHAGCPVLSGVKWVANKWIRSHGQMFRRRCVRHRGA